MTLQTSHIIGIVLAVAAVEVAGLWSGRRVKNAKEWATAQGNAGVGVVSGIVLGTLIGGQSTIGTAQLAFSFGLSSWWFTFGAALGCLLLAYPFAPALRKTGCTTVTEVVRNSYGKQLEMLSSVLCSVGIFISIVAQVLSAAALLTTLTPLDFRASALISVTLMALYAITGGVKSAGYGGIVKMILLIFASLVGGSLVLFYDNGIGGIYENIEHTTAVLSTLTNQTYDANLYHSVFARGIGKDLGSALSVILGVVCTQSYAQGVWAASNTRTSQKGILLAGFVAIIVGIASSFVGLYMRGHYFTAAEYDAIVQNDNLLPQNLAEIVSTAQAFPVFAMEHMHPLLGGIVLGTMLITVIIGGAGLTLGATAIVSRNIFHRSVDSSLQLQRGILIVILLLSAIVAMMSHGSYINDLGFLSMGLRVATVFLPLIVALFLPNRISKRWMTASVIASTALLFITKIQTRFVVDPIYSALGIGAFICLIALCCNKKK